MAYYLPAPVRAPDMALTRRVIDRLHLPD